MKLAMANANTTLPLFFYQICHDNVIKICYECEIIQNVQYLQWQKHVQICRGILPMLAIFCVINLPCM
jgi:hypothetical protein